MSVIHEIERLEAAAFDHPWDAAAITSTLSTPCARVRLIRTDGTIVRVDADFSHEAGHGAVPTSVAFTGFALISWGLDPGVVEILRIATDPESRRRGLASALLHALIVEARGDGMERIILEVAASNLAALALYRKAGLAEIHRRRAYYPDKSDAVIMEMRLTPGTSPNAGGN